MLRLSTVTIALFLLVVPSSAAKLIPDACVGGVALWNTRADVLSKKGPPLRKVRRNSYDILWHYRAMTVFFSAYDYNTKPPSGFVVVSVTSTDRNERTSRGIGVGSSERAAKRAYPSLSCVTSNGTRLCELPGLAVGHSTKFKVTQSRVSEISVSMDSGFDDGARQTADPRC